MNAQQGETELVTPVDEQNRPGLAALAYRVGTHGQFLSTMLARLSSADHPQLRAFTARDPGDLAIALLDGWATVGDVLSFYTERLANEGFLRSALDPRSVALLGALVGYAPRPGLGASTYLAYTVDSSAPRILIPAGSGAQNVPAGGVLAQSYETSADLIASIDWNDLPVRATMPTSLSLGDVIGADSLYLAGTTTNLKPNDRLLFDFGPAVGKPTVKPVVAVTPDLAAKRTQVAFAIETREQLYLKALRGLLDALADLNKPDPLLANAASWIGAPLSTLIGDPAQQPVAPIDIAPPLRTALARLAEECAVADVHDDGFAAFYLTNASTAAQAALNAAVLVDPDGTTVPTGDGELTPQGPTGDGAVSGITGLLGPLRLPPSVPPANSAALARSTSQAFQAGSDASIGLLAAADPRLSAQLYTALSAVDLTPTPPLRDVQAMRITAAPFGANAPLKPVLSSQGVVTGQTEWPFAELPGWTVTFDDIDAPVNTGTTSFVVGYTDGDTTWSSPDVSLDGPGGAVDQTVQAGPAQVHCALTPHTQDQMQEWTLTVVLTAGGQTRTLTIDLPTDISDRVFFVLADGEGNSVDLGVYQFGEPVSGTLGTDTVSAVWLDNEQELAQARRAPAVSVGSIPMTVTDQFGPHPTVLNLDAVYPGIVPNSWVVIERPTPDNATGPVQVRSVSTVSVAAYGLTAKVTQLTLAAPWLDGTDPTLAPVRRTTVRAQGDSLRLAQTPVTDDILGHSIDLDVSVHGLQTGRWLVVAGDRTDVPNARIPGGELVMLAGTQQVVDTNLPGDTVRTRLTLAADLAYTYARDTVHVYGNVVEANQGATRTEPIGSGDATATGQTFSLSSQPLTYLAADNPSGAQDTVILRVNGVQWHETDTLAGAGPTDRVFVLGNGAKTTVTFGDGVHGARLPTGVENVTATYRTGLGTGGNVPAGSITQPTSRPLGVRGVSNPLPATGGADPDTNAVARTNTPLRSYALDRLVSVRDYADFSAARAGIGRASAQRLTDGRRDVIHLTITGVDDAPIDTTDELVRQLRASLADFGDAHLPIVIAVRDLKLLVISANIKVLPDYSWPLVEPVIRHAVLDLFAPANRDLGQPAYASELISTVQAVPGVDYVDLDAFAGVAGSITPDDLNTVAEQLTPNPVVPAALATYQEDWYDVRDGDTLTTIAAVKGLTVEDLVRLNPWLPDAQLPAQPSSDQLRLLLRHGITPAQLAVVSSTVPDSLILKEITS